MLLGALSSEEIHEGSRPLDERGTAGSWCEMWLQTTAGFVAQYVEGRRRAHVLDYDDLLLLLGAHDARGRDRRRNRRRFDHVLVDEYQTPTSFRPRAAHVAQQQGRNHHWRRRPVPIYSFSRGDVATSSIFPVTSPARRCRDTRATPARRSRSWRVAADAVIELARRSASPKSLWSSESPRPVSLVSMRHRCSALCVRKFSKATTRARAQDASGCCSALRVRAGNENDPPATFHS